VIEQQERQPHAILDFESRLLKARKIARLIGTARSLKGAHILDIGTGAGYIAGALAAEAGPEGGVWAVDVRDQRRIMHGFSFTQVDDTDLPFEDGFFDVVLSNHVIEHVGERDDQLSHLSEIHRVLKPGGLAYLAVPNRWVLVEPHFRLPLLSWLPEPWRDPYVRAAGRGDYYDCNLPTRTDICALFEEADFVSSELTIEAMRVLREVESPGPFLRLLFSAPEPLLRLLLPINPTMIFLLRKPARTGAARA
jgi:SAM-dependent methyltransferase